MSTPKKPPPSSFRPSSTHLQLSSSSILHPSSSPAPSSSHLSSPSSHHLPPSYLHPPPSSHHPAPSSLVPSHSAFPSTSFLPPPSSLFLRRKPLESNNKENINRTDDLTKLIEKMEEIETYSACLIDSAEKIRKHAKNAPFEKVRDFERRKKEVEESINAIVRLLSFLTQFRFFRERRPAILQE